MSIAIKASLLLDGRGGPPMVDPVVFVHEGRIVAIERHDGFRGLAADVLEFPGGAITPGLIEAHAHLTSDRVKRTPEEKAQLDHAALLVTARRNAKTALEAGITALRDCGAEGDLAFRIKHELTHGLTPGPRVLVSGRPLTTPRGHCWFMAEQVRDAADVPAALEPQIEAGIDFVKVMATGGGMTTGTDLLRPQFPRDVLATIVDVAHRHGLRVAAHVRGGAAVPDCIAAGVDTIEHCSFHRIPDGEFEADPEVLAALRQSGSYVVPTIVAYSQGMQEGKRRIVREIYEAGVPLAVGTDAGVPAVGFGDVWREIEALAACGIPASEVLRAATYVTARALGIENETGSVEPGKWADMLVVEGDPLVDFSRLAHPIVVLKGGEIVAGAYRQGKR